MAELTTTRSDMMHFLSLFMLFLVVVAVSSIGGFYLYARHATCHELGYALAQFVLPINPRLDGDHDGEVCQSMR